MDCESFIIHSFQFKVNVMDRQQSCLQISIIADGIGVQ